jgi:hypothetical protein
VGPGHACATLCLPAEQLNSITVLSGSGAGMKMVRAGLPEYNLMFPVGYQETDERESGRAEGRRERKRLKNDGGEDERERGDRRERVERD